MKRLFILIFIFGLFYPIQAQSKWFKAVEFAVKLEDKKWSDWEKVNIDVKFDLSEDIIVIYTKELQLYKIIEILPEPFDSNGKQMKFKIMDQDYDIGVVRLRLQNNNTHQIYIDFANISWVYNIKPI